MTEQEDDDRTGGRWQSRMTMTEQGAMTEKSGNDRARGDDREMMSEHGR